MKAFSIIPWATDEATSYRALTQPPPPLPSLRLQAQPPGIAADFMRFDKDKKTLTERPQSKRTGYLGSSRMSRRELQTLSQKLAQINVRLVVDKKGTLPDFACAGFDPITGEMYLRKGATHFEAFHETQHAEQWAALGQEKYLQQTRFEREKHVFDKILENRNTFSGAEITAATKYIGTLS